MGFFSKIHNEELVEELRHEINTDVLLLGADGFAYFGNLQAIENCRIAIITPAIVAATSGVEIVTPGGAVVSAEFARIDLCNIVGKGTGIVSDPVYCDPCRMEKLNLEDNERVERCCLIHHLRRFIGDTVVLTTVGGFLFEGVLSDVCNDLAILTLDELFVPGCSGFISDRNIRSAVVNLEGLTSIAAGRCKCCK